MADFLNLALCILQILTTFYFTKTSGLQVWLYQGLLLPLPSAAPQELLLEHQLYLESREAIQREEFTVFDRRIYLFQCRMVSVAAAGSAARGAASTAPVSQDAYYRLVPRLSHLFPAPLKWETMVIPLSQNT